MITILTLKETCTCIKFIPACTLVLICSTFFSRFNLFAQSSEWIKTEYVDDEAVYFITSINDTLLAGSTSGLYWSTNQGEEWHKSCEIPYINSIAYYDRKYYAASYNSGVYQSENLRDWSNVSASEPNMVTSLLSSNIGLFASGKNGVYRLDESSSSWVKETVKNSCIHNEVIWQLVQIEDAIIAIGSNFIYKLHKQDSDWIQLKGRYEYHGLRSKVINNDLYISTSGGGLYHFDIHQDSLTEYLSVDDSEIIQSMHINDFLLHDSSLVYTDGYFINHKKTKTNVCNNILSALYADASYMLVGTMQNGIWKTALEPNITPRSIDELSSMDITPNPSHGEITIHLEIPARKRSYLSMLNSSGTIVYFKTFEATVEKSNLVIHHKIDFPGHYFFLLTDGINKIVRQIVIE